MVSLHATIRKEFGKKNKKLRKRGYLPGVLYGRYVKATPITLEYKEFENIYKEAGESSLISLKLEDPDLKNAPQDHVVLIRDAVIHPLRRVFEHADFYQIPMDEEIMISVPLVFVNESPAVKNEGAVLVRNVYELEIRAFPKDLPREISVDLSMLERVDDAILAKDLTLPLGVKSEVKEDFVIALVSSPQAEKLPAEAAPVPPLGEIKTEGEAKREEAAKKKEGEEAAA